MCKQFAEFVKMNSNLKKMTVDRLTFRHKCNKEDTQSLSALEQFKLTPAYHELQAKLKGKYTDKPEIESDARRKRDMKT